MRYTDIAIIGGGLAGSTAAAMLGRAGIASLLIDPHEIYPLDFRVEKLSGCEQLDRFARTGLAEAVLPSATHDGENWIARFGYLLDKPPSRQYGIMYADLIGAIRAQVRPPAERVRAKVVDLATSAERQTLTLSTGEAISARLVVLSNGLNLALRRSLGIEHQIISACHSISLGFDLVPVGRPTFHFPALTYFSERPGDRIPYLTLFPVGRRMRANLFAYRAADDPWLREMRAKPVETLNSALPRLRRITGEFTVSGDIKVRPGRSLCQHQLSPARHRPDRRCVLGHLPGHRHRDRQGVHRRRAALRRPYPGLACDQGHGRRQDCIVLRRSGQEIVRRMVDGKGVQLSRGHDRHHAVLAGAALGALPVLAQQRNFAADA